MKKPILGCIGIIVVGIVLITVIALVLETNPPVTQEPPWDSPQTRALAERACFDCHSNQTRWVWWTKLPFGSWLSVLDTYRGRGSLNFSEWGVARRGEWREGGNREIGEVIQNGSMPPWYYTILHPEAALNATEKQQLITGLQNSLK